MNFWHPRQTSYQYEINNSANQFYLKTTTSVSQVKFQLQSVHCVLFFILPSASEIWGKVMCLVVSVILSTKGGGLCMVSLPVWPPGLMFIPGVSVSGPMFLWGVCVQGSLSRGLCSRGGLCQGDPPDREPPYSKERAVPILLECILVLFWLHWIYNQTGNINYFDRFTLGGWQ